MIKIVYDDEQEPEDGLKTLFDRAAELVAEREGLESVCGEVSLFFAGEDEIRQMNLEYRSIDEPTDVLSFPMLELNMERDRGSPRAAPTMLGDIVICRQIAEKQAEEYGHGAERELAYLFTHGLLHLLGYDHENTGGRFFCNTGGRFFCVSAANTKEPSPCVTEEPSPCVMRTVEEEILGKMGLGR